FLPVDVLEIRIAAVALDPPQTGRKEFRGDPAAGIDAVWNSDGGPGADADEMPLVIAPRVEPGLILFAVIGILKQVITRIRDWIVACQHLDFDLGGAGHG